MSVFTQNAEICCPDCVGEVFANPELCDLVFTTNQVLAVLSILNVYKSSGPDEIPARILKETAHKIAPSLCDLFNKLLRLGSLLIQWKLANIVPVCNQDNKEYIKNYQLISLLCLASKVMERCCLLLLRIKYSLVGSCRYMASWQSVHVLRIWSRCLTLLVPSCTRGDKWTYLFRYV